MENSPQRSGPYALLTYLTAFIYLVFQSPDVLAGPLEDCHEYTTYGIPGSSDDLLCRKGFLLAHDPNLKTPIWVIEHLTKEKASDTRVNRTAFKPDPDLPRDKRAELTDYTGSGYDRGHMAPSADMKWDAQAMAECFYLSNMVPQVGKGMNQGIWKILEKKVRDLAILKGEVYIYTGPIYEQAQRPTTIGPNKVAVPTALFKIIFEPDIPKATAFIMLNKNLDGYDLPNFVVSVREVEEETGLDFFSIFNQEIQDILETVITEIWQ